MLPGATPPAEILAAYKIGDWNELRIVANGNHLQHFLNGKLTADVTDEDPSLGAKSGVLGLSRVLAAELAPFGITVNTVAPGFTRSGPRIESMYHSLPEERRVERVRPIKLGRWAELEEIASAVGYLASDDASYVVGAVLDVNGGSFMP